MTKPKPPISFRVLDGSDLDEWLAGRQKAMLSSARSIGEQARTELETWRAAQRVELARHSFTVEEVSCIADVLNGSTTDAAISVGGPGLVCADVMIAFARSKGASSYGAKWNIDEQELLDELVKLGPVADHALRYAISRWWDDQAPATIEGFRLYGINVAADPVAAGDR